MLGKDALSQALMAIAQDDGRCSASKHMNLRFHLPSFMVNSSGEGRSPAYMSTVSSRPCTSPEQMIYGTSPCSLTALLEISQN